MALPQPSATETVITLIRTRLEQNFRLLPGAAVDAVRKDFPTLWAAYEHEQARGAPATDTLQQLDDVAKQMREEADDNPCDEIVRRATALRLRKPGLSDGQLLDEVCKADAALAERYHRRDPKRHRWPVVKAAPTVPDGNPLEAIQQRLAAGETLDAIQKSSPGLWQRYTVWQMGAAGKDERLRAMGTEGR